MVQLRQTVEGQKFYPRGGRIINEYQNSINLIVHLQFCHEEVP